MCELRVRMAIKQHDLLDNATVSAQASASAGHEQQQDTASSSGILLANLHRAAALVPPQQSNQQSSSICRPCRGSSSSRTHHAPQSSRIRTILSHNDSQLVPITPQPRRHNHRRRRLPPIHAHNVPQARVSPLGVLFLHAATVENASKFRVPRTCSHALASNYERAQAIRYVAAISFAAASVPRASEP